MKRVFAADTEWMLNSTASHASSGTSKRRASWCVSSATNSAFYLQRLARPTSSDFGKRGDQETLETELPALDALLHDMLDSYSALEAAGSPNESCTAEALPAARLFAPLMPAPSDDQPDRWMDQLLDQLAVTPCDEALLSPALSNDSGSSVATPASMAALSPMCADTPPPPAAPAAPSPPLTTTLLGSVRGSDDLCVLGALIATPCSLPSAASLPSSPAALSPSYGGVPPPLLQATQSAPTPPASAPVGAAAYAAGVAAAAPLVHRGMSPPLCVGLDAPAPSCIGLSAQAASVVPGFASSTAACGPADLAALAAAKQERLQVLQAQAALAGDTQEGAELRQQLALALRRRATAQVAWANAMHQQSAAGTAAAPAAPAATGASGAQPKVFRPRRVQEEGAVRATDTRGRGMQPSPRGMFSRGHSLTFVPPGQVQAYARQCHSRSSGW